ncbi:PAS domain-containing sensor histidine kinase [Pseudoclavibacter sp. RFBB5]|uniref:sensor histidine kinase n=1 Tax=Pseudoclavibacter sp. RFBB5 TaxID=2080574 RepID=UPI000CE80ADD|nr:PAS domain-containing sensor histidine kinase [Pseudoclavibacter sp. RFBB5]PPG33453.1 PAS domain-containing sensor histidine kinase [Pseudoclavibacter sp. RFBB5]
MSVSVKSSFGQFTIDTTSPAIRQLASVFGLVLAFGAMVVVPGVVIMEPVAAWTGVVIVFALAGVAFVIPWPKIAPLWQLVLPVITMLALGLFRAGTGGAQSMFTSLILLPLIFIAAAPGRRAIWLAIGTSVLTVAIPYLIGTAPWSDPLILRVVFTPLVFAVIASIINELSHRARVQVESSKLYADERDRRLREVQASNEAREVALGELRASEAFNRSVWNAAVHEIAIVTELDGTIVAWGPGARNLLGPASSEVVRSRNVTEFLSEASACALRGEGEGDEGGDRLLRRLVQIAGCDEQAGTLVELVRTDGEPLSTLMTCAPRKTPEGDVVGHIFIAYDMTQVNEASRLKDEFVGTISHELRTPLSSILGYLELARDEESGPLNDEQRHYLEVAERNAQRLLALVGDLLFVAQVDAGKVPMEFSPVRIGEVVRQSLETALPTAAQASVELVREPGNEEETLAGDAMRLGQAIDNLISNAVKFTPRGGVVRVGVRRDGNQLVVYVSDTGMGIPEAEMHRLFTKFFRATTATKQAVPGVGLGLNITLAIVKAHGGRLEASSTVGEGTTFEMHLPVAAR